MGTKISRNQKKMCLTTMIKDDVKIMKIFIRFLKSNKAYGKFMFNAHSENGMNMRKCHFHNKTLYRLTNDDIINYNGRNIINNAFLWRDTAEGEEFWGILDMKWRYIVGFRI